MMENSRTVQSQQKTSSERADRRLITKARSYGQIAVSSRRGHAVLYQARQNVFPGSPDTALFRRVPCFAQFLIRRFGGFTGAHEAIKHIVLDHDEFMLANDPTGILFDQAHNVLCQALRPQEDSPLYFPRARKIVRDPIEKTRSQKCKRPGKTAINDNLSGPSVVLVAGAGFEPTTFGL